MMAASLIDIFPPEVQTLYGVTAIVSAVLGLLVWGAGIKIARLGTAILLGAAASALAVWALPAPLGISPLTAGIIGFALGMLAGAITFRFLQGVLLAACLALAVGGIYFRTQVAPASLAAAATTLPIQDLQIATERLPETPEAAPVKNPDEVPAATFVSAVHRAGEKARDVALRQWEAIPSAHRFWLGLTTGLTALTALLVALLFPRHTTWIATAALGTILLACAGYALITLYAPQYGALIPTQPISVWSALAVLMLLGLLTQRRLFWPAARKPAPAPAPAA